MGGGDGADGDGDGDNDDRNADDILQAREKLAQLLDLNRKYQQKIWLWLNDEKKIKPQTINLKR